MIGDIPEEEIELIPMTLGALYDIAYEYGQNTSEGNNNQTTPGGGGMIIAKTHPKKTITTKPQHNQKTHT